MIMETMYRAARGKHEKLQCSVARVTVQIPTPPAVPWKAKASRLSRRCDRTRDYRSPPAAADAAPCPCTPLEAVYRLEDMMDCQLKSRRANSATAPVEDKKTELEVDVVVLEVAELHVLRLL